ncbi:MAG: prolyl oligopeptidase family serine peptidase [Pyrinomonadaceae bacterium]
MITTQRRKGSKDAKETWICLGLSLRLCPFASLRELIATLTTLLVSLSLTSSFAQSSRPFAPADILRVAGVSDAQISPNGQWVVYTVSTTEGDRTISTLWLARAGQDFPDPPTSVPPQTRQPDRDWREIARPASQLLPQPWVASTPRWSPDSTRIALLSNRDDQNGIWVVNITKPDPRFVAPVQSTNFFIPYAGESFAWSPDSKRIAYISAGEEPSESAGAARKPDDPRVIDRIQYKSRTSFSDNRRTHVWIVEVDKPEPRQLTSGLFYDHAITFSARGDEIGFLSNHEPDPDANNNSDIFAVDFGGQVRQLTQTKGCEYEPSWSPDGKWVAYTATKREVTTIDSVAEDTHVWVVPAAGGGGRELTAQQDRRARSPRWSPDSRSILFLAGDRGKTTLFRVGLDARRIDRMSVLYFDGQLGATLDDQDSKARTATDSAVAAAPSFQIGSFSVAGKTLPVTRPSGVTDSYFTPLAFTLTDALHPAEVWVGVGSGTPLRRLSAHNDSLTRSVSTIAPEEINFRSFDGTPVQGWLMKPVNLREDRKYPLILSVHGGPHGMSGWGFNAAFQAYAARGYAVLYVNPRGSSGYGQKFSDGTLNEWGGGDYKDLMAGVDETLKRYSWIDQSRLGVTGGSYGGFMTNWIITQTPRFKAAVASASVSNLVSFYSTSLYQDLIHAEFGGFPWDNYEQLWQWSPLRYVRQAQTPTLFIHGEMDNDVHITQAEEMYMALKRRGVETVFVRYPREGHGLREPRHRVDALERTLAWFDRFLK